MASDPGSITIAFYVREYAIKRAAQLGLPRNVYLGILLRNYLNGPLALLLPVEEPAGKLKRVRMPCGIEATQKALGKRAAKRWKLSFSALMESLILADAESDSESLVIWPINKSTKPLLEI